MTATKEDSLGDIEQDSLLLEALVDDELSVRDADALERRISTDERLQLRLDSLRFLRQEFREFFIESSNLGARKVDLWSAISREIEHHQADSWLRSHWADLREFLTAPGPSRGAFAAMAAGFIAVLSFQLGAVSSAPTASPRSQFDTAQLSPATPDADFARYSSFSPTSVDSPDLAVGGRPAVENVGYFAHDHSAGLAPAAGSEVYLGPNPSPTSEAPNKRLALQFSLTAKGPSGEVRQFRGLVPMPNGAVPVLENRRDFMRSGMRTPAADIEWVRSDKTFKILPGGSASQPPVIWVAREESGRP